MRIFEGTLLSKTALPPLFVFILFHKKTSGSLTTRHGDPIAGREALPVLSHNSGPNVYADIILRWWLQVICSMHHPSGDVEATLTEDHTLAEEVKKVIREHTDIGAQLAELQGKLWQLLAQFSITIFNINIELWKKCQH